MFRDNSAVAIDIGSRCIKIVHGKTKKNGLKVVDYGICRTPRNSYVDGYIKDKRDIIAAISDLMREKKFKSKKAILGIKGDDIIIRHMEMPIMADKQLKQAVKLEIGQYLPMDLNQYVIDSKIINKIDTKDKKSYNILLVAAPKEKVSDHYYIAQKLGFKVIAIDLFANSVTRFFEGKEYGGVFESRNKCIALIDIGYTTSAITLVEDGKLFFERELNMGVRELYSMIRKIFAAESEEVFAVRNYVNSLSPGKNHSQSEDPRVFYANNCARQLIDSWVDNIMKVLDFYLSGGFNKTIDSLYIYGGGAKIKGLVDYVKSSVNINTEVFHKGLLPSGVRIPEGLEGDLEMYVNCLGLLLRKE